MVELEVLPVAFLCFKRIVRSFALSIFDDGKADLFEPQLIDSLFTKLIFSPPCGKADLVVKDVFRLWKADYVNMFTQVKVLLGEK